MRLQSVWFGWALILLGCGKSPEAPPAKSSALWTGEQYAGFRAETMSPADRALAENVHRRLLQSPALRATELYVVVRRGDVQLNGSVASDFEREMAEQLTRRVSGVKRVHNELAVVAPPRQDPDQRLRRELQANLTRVAPRSNVEAHVKSGVVTLTGNLTDWDAYDEIMLAVYRAGPKTVVNELSVRTREPDRFIEFDVQAEPAAETPSDQE